MHDFKLLANDDGDNVSLPQLHDSHCKHFIWFVVSRDEGKRKQVAAFITWWFFSSFFLCGAAIFFGECVERIRIIHI